MNELIEFAELLKSQAGYYGLRDFEVTSDQMASEPCYMFTLFKRIKVERRDMMAYQAGASAEPIREAFNKQLFQFLKDNQHTDAITSELREEIENLKMVRDELQCKVDDLTKYKDKYELDYQLAHGKEESKDA